MPASHVANSSRTLFLRVCSIVALGASFSIGLAQQPLRTLIVGVDHRQTTSLNGPWHYLIEQPPARELYDDQGNVRDSGYAQNTRPNISTGPHNSEYDFYAAPTLKVPGDWNSQDPTLFRFEGVVWYQREFQFQPKPGSRTFLHVGAANYRSFVWVNGKRICQHEGGFTPFDCEVTAAAHAGTNAVVIAVDSTRHKDDIPTVSYDWFNYGGITRDVSLVTVPDHFIDDYDVHLQHGNVFSEKAARTLSGYVHVQDATAGTSVTIRIPEAGVNKTVTTDANGRAEFTADASSLTLWSPASPKLYRVSLASGSDEVADEIGFRDLRVDGTKILLNGKPVFLQGANVHAEAPLRGGRVNTDEDVKNLFGMLHDLHANFARLCHYPHDERMERYADRDGIMLWSEIPLWQRISFDKSDVYDKAVVMLHEMIRRDRNKASVIFWSVSNETPNNPTRTKFLTDLANEARRTDPTRLITSALIGPKVSEDQIRQEDPLMQALDVVGQNEYIGWYEGQPEEADRKVWTFAVNKPVIFSEFGAEAKIGNHGGDHDRWTEEQEANVYEHQFAMMRKIPQVRGVTPWVLMDFRSTTRNIPKLQDGYNRKGLFSEKMEKKKAFEVVRKAYEGHTIGKAE
ncbi:beta-galactosidase/beta-glucuronidase [Terriglobus roseus DSM 18391]|uniref:Beta-galactosidase/beta-glucuronidase n=1 Tax=Terriglobus roseus (strain DSM 18391 / NRRL B-41598 / KBS 63) TaxID=926566 RepID=I3ZLJ6_TERRK|nr:glycoside hydrolase family 2 TIM barrel-domain containing protein [Terriglobus roseus]AFL90114.1 beta-galactosidase/beta-glucuronidase [Terriglobus roseus DSM 18391]